MITPDYIFESSWEVCNKVGGIYTVLSTKANVLQQQFPGRLLFVGPELDRPDVDFEEDKTLFPDWTNHVKENESPLRIRVGRWNIPGKPPVVLVDYKPCFSKRDKLYFSIWESFGVDSSKAYGDYDESCIFACSVALVIQSFYRFYRLEDKKVIAHFNEWTVGMGALYLQKHLPQVATVFTTHATSIGRSIAGNGKPLYDYMAGYDGDQMARELNMDAKHSVEKQTAHHADCFTTVSDITAMECRQLLNKVPDVVTPNGFEPDFVPAAAEYTAGRKVARETLLRVAEKLLGRPIKADAFLISTSGRYEYRNKGLDVFLDAMNHLRLSGGLERETIAFIMVPAWVYAARGDLKEILEQNIQTDAPLQTPFITHWLHRMEDDRIMNFISQAGFTNRASEKLNIIFIPCYLDGNDGIFNLPYYDLLTGMDATVFPSYYEPWGYTPMESIAFGIPTITTDLAGFGLWAKNHIHGDTVEDGAVVIRRTDSNYHEVVGTISGRLLALIRKEKAERSNIRKHCMDLASKAEWKLFIAHYLTAYDIALANAAGRIKNAVNV